MGTEKQRPTLERRRSPLRNQVQAWFEALQRHIGDIEGADAIATLIKGWTKPEDIMHAYPAMVPLFLDIIWRSRKTPAFADLLRTEAGEVAEKPTDVLAFSQKTFDDVVIAHLLGTVRLTCERLQRDWLSLERERRRSAVANVPVLGPILRAFGFFRPAAAGILLAEYPRKGLYEALKPYLSRRDQFSLVEALVTIPTRTVATLGSIVGALDSAGVIRTLAGLNKSDIKVALEVAETYVQGVGGAALGTGGNEAVDQTADLARALSDIVLVSPNFVNVAAANRQLAKDAIVRFAPIMKAEIWAILTDAESLRRIAECPSFVVETLQSLAVEVHQRVSMVLAEMTDPEIAAFALKTLRDGAEPEQFLSWIQSEIYVTAWKQFVAHLKRDTGAPREIGPLGKPLKAAIKTVCDRSARVFAEIGNPQKHAA